jgi:putative transcriptional regulator
MLDISRDTLKGFEYGRTCVRFDVGERICKALNCNQRWLATGIKPMHPHFSIDQSILGILDSPAFRGFSFSMVFDRLFLGSFERRYEMLKKSFWKYNIDNDSRPSDREPSVPSIGAGVFETRLFLADTLGKSLTLGAKKLPSYALEKLDKDVASLLARYASEYADDIERLASNSTLESLQEYTAMEKEVREKLFSDTSRRISTDTSARKLNALIDPPISQRIKEARIKMNLSQAEAARKWGFTLGAIRDWEQGRKKPRGLYRGKLEVILKEMI